MPPYLPGLLVAAHISLHHSLSSVLVVCLNSSYIECVHDLNLNLVPSRHYVITVKEEEHKNNILSSQATSSTAHLVTGETAPFCRDSLHSIKRKYDPAV